VRAAIYARISQDRTGAGLGVERQRQDCQTHCDARGWEVVEVFTDSDISAYSGRPRPGYKALLAAIESKRVGAVVVWHLDRLHRSNRELEDFIALVERTGCRVESVTGGDYDLTTSDGRFMARVVGAAARKESEDKARRIRRKQRELAEAGRWNGGGRRPFGYGVPMRDPDGQPVFREDGRPVLDYHAIREPEAQLIREAARRVLAGESTWSILRDWTARGVPTVTGAPWNNRALTQILMSPRIAGLRAHHGKIVAETADWPAVLDRETWEAVRAVLAGRSTSPGPRPTYLLSGLVVCGLCGTKMRSHRIRGRRRYTCASGPSGGCGNASRGADKLEAFVTGAVLAVRGGDAGSGEAPEPPPEVRGYEARLERLEEEYAVEGMWSKDQYLRLRADLEAKLHAARRQATDAAERPLIQGDWVEVGLGPWWEEASPEQRRNLVLDTVASVVVQPVGRGYRGDCHLGNTGIEWTEKGQAAAERLGSDDGGLEEVAEAA
jgi:DNA invertase Pin-like site-specific DNA recombinase